MIWCIDIGNTRTLSGRLLEVDVVRHDQEPTARLATAAGARRWARRLSRWGPPRGVVVSSVVPAVDGRVRVELVRATGLKPLFVRPGPGLGIPIGVKNPRELGADRLVNALGARELYGAPVIVVDYGTATTFDVVDARGRYLGGAILPGIGTSLSALHRYTAKLPTVSFRRVRNAVGRSTEEAIRSGVYHGAVGQTREILLVLRKELGKVAPAVATGGWCHLFEDSGLFHHISPDLTLKGMALLWRRLQG
jgi:type III pantothenate kinase